jgi:hypothetical protein
MSGSSDSTLNRYEKNSINGDIHEIEILALLDRKQNALLGCILHTVPVKWSL